MATTPSEEALDVLLKAAYPVVCVYTQEEKQLERAAAELIRSRKTSAGVATSLWVWSATEGLYPRNEPTKAGSSLLTPMEILDHIIKCGVPAIFVLRDFFPYMAGDSGPGVQIQRKLKDLVYALTSATVTKHVIISGHHFEIPSTIEKLVTLLDWRLPNDNEINKTLFSALGSAEKGVMAEERKRLQGDATALERVVNAAKGLTLFEIENVIARSLVESKKIDVGAIISEKKSIIKKSGVLQFYEADTSMDSIGGLGTLKGWLGQRSLAFSKGAKKYGLPTPKGVLIIGIPGTGKSLVSKTIGNAWAMPVLRLDVGALFGSLVGESEANMRRALKTATAMAPCVLWVDEIEKGFSKTQGNDGGTTARVFGSFLSWLQDKQESVFVVATANDISALPPEMLRKGRFDEIFFVDLPNEIERLEILKIHIKKHNRTIDKFDFTTLVTATEGFSGAELEQVVVEALYKGYYNNREPSIEDLNAAANESVPLSKTMMDNIVALRTWAQSRARPAGMVLKPVEEVVLKKSARMARLSD